MFRLSPCMQWRPGICKECDVCQDAHMGRVSVSWQGASEAVLPSAIWGAGRGISGVLGRAVQDTLPHGEGAPLKLCTHSVLSSREATFSGVPLQAMSLELYG